MIAAQDHAARCEGCIGIGLENEITQKAAGRAVEAQHFAGVGFANVLIDNQQLAGVAEDESARPVQAAVAWRNGVPLERSCGCVEALDGVVAAIADEQEINGFSG